jgi:glycosyltransferase involved in cell wall biosynthesis
MSRLRLVLITRRFWPLVGGSEMNMANLAASFAEAGHRVTILTAAWNPDWPAEIQHRGVRVQRIPQSSRWLTGLFRYMRGLARWLKEHRGEFDLAYVSTLKQDAYVAVGMGRRFQFPVALRADASGPTGDFAWQQGSRVGKWVRRRCRLAAAVVAPSPAIVQELIDSGYPADRLQLIPNGVSVAEERSPQRRLLAREALGTAHAVLSLGRDTKLAVYTGRLIEEKGLSCLVEAWARVLKNHSNTRLWLVGEGPLRDRLAEKIERLHIRGRCVLVGSFDSVEELLAAADLFVLPSRDEDASIALLEAMGSGLPIVATDSPGTRTLITPGTHGLLCPLGDPITLAAAMSQLLDSPLLAKQYGTAARERAQADFALSSMVDRHLDLFERLIRESKTLGDKHS